MQKRALEKKKKRAPENHHRLQCKSLFNVADLVNGMWKVAPKNKNLIFGLKDLPLTKLVNWIIAHNFGEPKCHFSKSSFSWEGKILEPDIVWHNVL